MKRQVALVATVTLGIGLIPLARAVTNDISSIALSLPKTGGIGQTGSASGTNIMTPHAWTPAPAPKSAPTVNNYSLRVLKPNQGTNYCLHIFTPATGTNYFIHKLP